MEEQHKKVERRMSYPTASSRCTFMDLNSRCASHSPLGRMRFKNDQEQKTRSRASYDSHVGDTSKVLGRRSMDLCRSELYCVFKAKPFSTSRHHAVGDYCSNNYYYCRSTLLYILNACLRLLKLPFTLCQFLFFWIIPVAIFWCSCLLFLFLLSVVCFNMIKHALLSPPVAQYPMTFKPRPTSLMVIKPYVDFSFGPLRAFENVRLCEPGTCSFNISDGNSLSSLTMKMVEDPQYFTSIQLNEVDRQRLTKETLLKNPAIPIYRHLIGSHFLTTDVMVGFSSFLNRSWDAFNTQGVSVEERCLYYHYTQHLGYHKEAADILGNNDWQDAYFQYTSNQPTRGSRYVDVVLRITHDPLSKRFFNAKALRNTSALTEADVLNDSGSTLRVQVVVELFDRNCSLIARSDKFYVLRRSGWFIQTLKDGIHLLYTDIFGKKGRLVHHDLLVFERFPEVTDSETYTTRVQVTPAIPGLTGCLTLNPRTSPRFIAVVVQRFPLLTFMLIFIMCVIPCATICTMLFGGIYTIFLLNKTHERRKTNEYIFS